MNRWIKPLIASLALACAGAAFSQTLVREAPRDVQPGRLSVTLPPQATLDGHADRLSPGARIRDTRNMLVLSGQLAGKTVPVLYRRDSAGLLHEIWILTEDEYARLPQAAGANPEAVAKFHALLNAIFGARR